MIKGAHRPIAAIAAALAIGIGGAVWATSAASASPTRPAVAIPECRSGQLAVWVSPDLSNGAAGSFFYPLEFTNVSSHTCFLIGYPGVSAIDSKGHQLGRSASREPNVPRKAVILRPGATAHAILRNVDVGVFPPASCKPTTPVALKVFPPDQTVFRTAFYSVPACSKAGPVYLTITRIAPGLTLP